MIAVIADIHGNSWALDAVLEDIDRRGIHRILNLGDHFWGVLDPRGTAERLLKLDAVSILGNQDRELLEPEGGEPSLSLRFTKSQLAPEHFEWIRELPATAVVDGYFLCHGSPASDLEYLTESVTPAGVVLRSVDAISASVANVPQEVVLCGHTHVPRLIQAGGKMIVNPGSTGLPAYRDHQPLPHRMENGSPHARYAILDSDRVEFVALAYDWEAAARAAQNNGRADWAHALRTGWAL